jgi:diguanylate cyclase (GGDEF)-like protein/PAS domain S-box-containing protein
LGDDPGREKSVSGAPFEERRRRDPGELASVADSAPFGIIRFDTTGRVTYLNEAVVELSGRSSSEWLDGDAASTFVHPDDQELVRSQVYDADGERDAFVHRVMRPDGEVRWIRVRTAPHQSADGAFNGWVSALVDITDEVEHRRRAELLASTLESTTDLTVIVDPDGQLLFANPAIRTLCGVGLTDPITTETLQRLATDELLQTLKDEVLPAVRAQGTWNGEVTLQVSGRVIPASVVMSAHYGADGAVEYYSTIIRDISDRKAAEARFRALVQHATDIVTVVDGQGIVRYSSPATERILGYSTAEVVGRSVFDFVHTDDNLRSREALLTTLLKPEVKRPIELRVRHADGTFRVLEVVASNRLDDRAVAGVVFNSRDVTERKAADEARRQSEIRFTTLVENVSDLVTVLDADGTVQYVSPSARRLFGYPEGFGPGQTPFDLVHPDDRDEVARVLEEITQTAGPTPIVRFRVQRADGAWLWLEASATNLLHEPAVGGVVVIGRDITPQREAEEALASREARSRGILQNVSEAVMVLDVDSEPAQVRWATPSVEALLGHEPRDLRAMFERFVHPDDLQMMVEAALATRERGHDMGPITFRTRRADGTWRTFEAVSKDLRDDPTVGGVVFTTRDITVQREATAAVERRLAFEDLLTRISTRFVNLPDRDQDIGIRAALREIGEFTGADRAHVFLVSDDGNTLTNIHEWCANGVESQQEARQSIEMQAFPWGRTLLERHIVIDIPRVAALGDQAAAERDRLLALGCQSILWVPLVSGDRLRGCIGLDAVREPTSWTEDQIRLLEAAGGMVLAAFARGGAHAALRESEERYRAIVEDQTDLICRYRPDGLLTFVNEAYARYHGTSAHALVGRSFFELIPEHDRATARSKMGALTPDQPVQSYVYRTTGPDGAVHWHEWTERALFDGATTVEYQAVGRDVTEQREAEVLVSDQACILEMIATGVGLPEILTEVCRVVEGHSPDARCSVLLVDDSGAMLVPGAAPSLPPGFVQAAEKVPIGPLKGSCATAAFRREPVLSIDIATDPLWAECRDLPLEYGLRSSWSTPIMSSSGEKVLGTLALYHHAPRAPSIRDERIVDIAVQIAAIAIERKAAEDRLSYQARHDHLTGLPNRVLLPEFIGLALARARRQTTATGLLFLDVDRFKLVNDTLGHDAGDELLVALADRLRSSVRLGDVVARFGGDEFVVIADELATTDAEQQAVGLAHRILEAVQEPFMVNGEEQFLTASIGIALANPGHDRVEVLLRNADAAMYQAKEHGRARIEVFDETLQRRVRNRHDIGNALHRAVERGEFRVLYQPIVSLSDGQCVGVEALLRWQHPERGVIKPHDFLEVAEETGLIVPIGNWVLEEVCRQAAEWQEGQLDDAPFVVSLNLSARQLNRPGLVELVARSLASTGVDPARIGFEITESVLMATGPTMIDTVAGLADLGARLSIDDFGTGYSSLEYLKRLRTYSIKIDRSFVTGLCTGSEDRAIVGAVVNLGHALDLRVVADGVNTESQLRELGRLGCDAAQGYLFSPPQQAGELAELVRRPRTGRLPGVELIGP